MSNNLSRYFNLIPLMISWDRQIKLWGFTNMKCQQKNTGYNTSAAFFPNRKIHFSPPSLPLVTATKPYFNHTPYRCIRTPIRAADRAGLTKQLSAQHIPALCSPWLLFPAVPALLSAPEEGEVGIIHMDKAKHIFNSSAKPGLRTLDNTASMWNWIQLRPATGSH